MKRWLVMSALFVSACDCCVARGAKVKTLKGTKNVEDLQVGDELIVVDPQTLEQHVSAITAIRSSRREVGQLHYGSGRLSVTSSHPLYDPRAKAWAPAGDWLLGVREEFVSESGPTRVTKAERFVGVEEVFDLTVAHELHTFVANGVVVHNKPSMTERVGCSQSTGFLGGEPCVCGPGLVEPLATGRVACPGGSTDPTCDCGFDGTASWWTSALGSDRHALRDGAWWTTMEKGGPGEVFEVVPWSADPWEDPPVLPGSPNVLRVRELGDGSAASLTRAVPEVETLLSVTAWLQRDGVFPRALALSRDGADVLVLGVDREQVWFQTPGAKRWVASVPSDAWHKFEWQLLRVSPTSFRLSASLAPVANAPSVGFHAETTGEALEAFADDGGVFSFGDAGVPDALVLGHHPAADGGTGELRITGVTLSAW